MPAFDIIKKITPKKTFRVQSVIGQFDIQSDHIQEKFTGNIDIDSINWNVGAIIGASGTGKSTIANELFNQELIKGFKYTNQSIIDDMPDKSMKEITTMFNKVGFSSPPSWLKPYSVLSNGEKMRVDLARALLEDRDLVVFDEFTSVVDRQIAKIGSFAVSKVIKKEKKKFVAVSCHYDILDWLEPDWVFDTNSMTFFLPKNTSDQSLMLKLKSVQEHCGKNLGVITI